MKPYFIVLENEDSDQHFHRAVFWAVSFPEAVREAYNTRLQKGHQWNITSVSLDEKWNLNFKKGTN